MIQYRQMSMEVPYFICTVMDHANIKQKLLKIIEDSEGEHLNIGAQNISKTDWNKNSDAKSFYQNFVNSKNENYYKILEPYLNFIMTKVLPNENDLYVSQGWFNQYQKLNHHSFHAHSGAVFAMVYYLELSESGPKTELQDYFGKSIIPDVKEGDILVFPGFIKHRSAPNKSTERKTVLAFNIEKNN